MGVHAVNKRDRVAWTAERLARTPFHGNVTGQRHNLSPIISHFKPESFRFRCRLDSHIRGYIRIPNGYRRPTPLAPDK